jgi:acetylornithine deacetylase/succinyl-diaminopimelate desuccinylase-like protein
MKAWIDHFDQQLDQVCYPDLAAQTINYALAIQQIAAPTFHERARAEHVAAAYRSLGLNDVGMDAACNVYGRLPGKSPRVRSLMISAHTDTVFSAQTDLTIRRSGDLIYGPGVGDNSAGVAGMLTLASFLTHHRITPDCDLWFVATTGEEGLGDLAGMRAAVQTLREQIGCVVNLEGLAFGHIYNAGIAVRRLHITASAPGGHSWLHFGRPSAVHAIIALGAKLLALPLPDYPRTTYNIGMIEGGESINSIAAQAGLWLDLRSEDSATLEQVEQRVRALVQGMALAETSFRIDVVGDRPAGAIARDHPLIAGAMAALEKVGVRGTLESGSTDANIPLAAGIPAVTVGITRGGNAHRLDEYMESAPIEHGLRQFFILTLAAAAWLAEKRDKIE